MLQTINRGIVANDGTGDPNRTAWGKVNEMMGEMFTRPDWSRNKAHNGCLRFWQRGTSLTPNDNVYGPDRIRVLAEANGTVTVARSTSSLPIGATAKATATVAVANNKFGFFQPYEADFVRSLRSLTVAFGIDLAATAGIGDIKMAIVEWTGTADSISGDPISSWGSAGAAPTLAAGWAYLNTPANLNVQTTFATYSVEATVGASANNLALMWWSDDKSTTITTDILQFAKINFQIVEGKEDLTNFEPAPYALEYLRCARFYFKTYDVDTTPGTAVDAGKINTGLDGITSAVHNVRASIQFPVPMRTAPSTTIYKADGTSGNWTNCASASVVETGQRTVSIEGITASGTEARVSGHLVATAEL